MSRAGSGGSLDRLGAAALIAVLVGAVGSVSLTVSVGVGRDVGPLLLLLFAIWVLAPFAALVLAHRVARRWSVVTRATLHCLMLVLALATLIIYIVDTVRNAGGQDAFTFVVVPLVSWALMALVLPTAAFVSGRLSRGGDQT